MRSAGLPALSGRLALMTAAAAARCAPDHDAAGLFEAALNVDPDATWVLSQDELVRRFGALPEATFPQTRQYATQLTSGAGHERFDFALGMLIDNLAQATPRPAAN
jgi:hypothetical protein